uniref:Uncharacterized protein n=1 Tax=Glossina palpalis gambiensis TaxID=67801 RepID=A0A1B0BR26_9MUSC
MSTEELHQHRLRAVKVIRSLHQLRQRQLRSKQPLQLTPKTKLSQQIDSPTVEIGDETLAKPWAPRYRSKPLMSKNRRHLEAGENSYETKQDIPADGTNSTNIEEVQGDSEKFPDNSEKEGSAWKLCVTASMRHQVLKEIYNESTVPLNTKGGKQGL